jgi:hypothetical protein
MGLEHRLECGLMDCDGGNIRSRDTHRWRTLTFFGLPVIAMILAGRADVNNAWCTAVWTAALVTMGTVCLVNTLRCGTHCYITGPFFLGIAGVSLLFGLGLVALGKNGWNLIGISTVIGSIVLCCVSELFLGKYRNARAHVEQSSAVRRIK